MRHKGVINISEEIHLNCMNFDRMMERYNEYLQDF
jgi:hypothetical protein